MVIVGIHSGASSSLTILKDGKNIFSASEERFSRKKEHIGFPYLALEHVFKEKIIAPSDVKIVARTSSMHKTDDMKCYKGHDWIKEIFYQHGCSDIDVILYDHHLAHGASAYHGSGWDDALVVTSDGYGDGLSGAVYRAKNGQLEQINAVKDQDSIGLLYAGVTSHLGFIADRHEGKITGLAAYGKDTGFCQQLKAIVQLDKGTLYNTKNQCASIEKYIRKKHYTSRKMIISHCLETLGLSKTIKFFWYYLDVLNKRKNFRRETLHFFDKNYSPEDFAYGIQTFAEDILCDWISHWVKVTGVKKVALAGGVFANVKINQRITERCGVDEIFIYPNMSDGGLAYGVATLEYYKNHAYNANQNITDTMYLGPEYSNEQIVSALQKDDKITWEKSDDIAHDVAELIANRTIVGWFQGRMEFGPRALGARSVVAMADDATINDWLNKRMQRTEFMPFAPSVMGEHMDDIFHIPKRGFKRAAEYMTITYDVKEKWRHKIQAVNHVDNTARPQMVTKKSNPLYYNMLSHVYQKTGLPLVINTSFNVHEEPIVMSPEDALSALHRGMIDVVAIGDYLVRPR